MVNTVKLKELFEIEYGNQFDKNKLNRAKNGINFVSRTSENLGVDDSVRYIEGVKPYEAGLITATLGGTYLLSCFIQQRPFYTGQNIKVLRPLNAMSFNEKVFYCLAISSNRFRYSSHGREANKTFDDILVPRFEELPLWVGTNNIYQELCESVAIVSNGAAQSVVGNISIGSKRVRLSEIFDIMYGHNLELNSLTRCVDGVNFASRTAADNGVSAKVKRIAGLEPVAAGAITVAGGGSVLETFLQTEEFYSGRDMFHLQAKVELSMAEKLFYCMCIRANKYKYNYGRQANRTLSDLLIPDVTEIPDWVDGVYGGILVKWSEKGTVIP